MSLIQPRTGMYATAQRLGLITAMVLALDAGDALSFTTAGGTDRWWDQASASHFWRGSTGSAEGNDPTYVGSPGNRSSGEYFQYDGGDRFTSQLAGAGAWFQDFHKDNAKFTIACTVYKMPGVNTGRIFATSGGNLTDVGIQFLITGGGLEFTVYRGASPAALPSVFRATGIVDGWNFLAVSVDEAAGIGILQVNSGQNAFVSTYNSPASVGSSSVPILGSDYNNSLPAPNGTRVANMLVWNPRALSSGELWALFMAIRGKWSI